MPNDSRSARDYKPKWFNEGDLHCSGDGCSNPIPAGFYGANKRVYLCCSHCFTTYYRKNYPVRRCRYCKRKFIPRSSTVAASPFCSTAHHDEWRRAQVDKRSGRFHKLMEEFLAACGPKFYSQSTIDTTRYELSHFFEFLTQSGIRSLEKVQPKTISAFLTEFRKRRPVSAGAAASRLRLLFDWLLMEGRRKSANPVLRGYHSTRQPKRLPRPYTQDEMALIWSALEKKNDLVLLVGAALGAEAGLRIAEVANLRVQDVNLSAQEVFVRVPNKTKTERISPFHTRAKQYLEQWLAKRGERDHDFLLVSPTGRPLKKYNLRKRLDKVLKPILPGWHFHRLRHYASTTMRHGGADMTSIMATFGWRNPAVMAGYTALVPADVRAAYDRAMEEAKKPAMMRTTTQSLEEYMSTSGQPTATPEDTKA